MGVSTSAIFASSFTIFSNTIPYGRLTSDNVCRTTQPLKNGLSKPYPVGVVSFVSGRNGIVSTKAWSFCVQSRMPTCGLSPSVVMFFLYQLT